MRNCHPCCLSCRRRSGAAMVRGTREGLSRCRGRGRGPRMIWDVARAGEAPRGAVLHGEARCT